MDRTLPAILGRLARSFGRLGGIKPVPQIFDQGLAMKSPSQFRFETSRRIAAPAERLFTAWTTPAEIPRWLGPGACQVTSVEADVRVGGRYRFEFLMDGEVSSVCGVYKEIAPPRHLAFTWRHETGPQRDFGETLVTVDFVADGDVTEVRIRHERFLLRSARDNHRAGWDAALDNLAAWVLAATSSRRRSARTRTANRS